MELKSFLDKAGKFIKKYRYLLLVIVIGFFLLVIPTGKVSKSNITPTTQPQAEKQSENLESKLSLLLSKISGAGRVEVLLTYKSGEEYLFQENESNSNSQDADNKQTDTVIITDSEHNQAGLPRIILAPTYRGAVIICQGAEDPSVRLAIVDAVSNATGLPANRISVLKMK